MIIQKSIPANVPVTLRTVKAVEGDPVNPVTKEILKTLGTTGAGVYVAKAGWQAFQASNTVTHTEIFQGLVSNGVTADKASAMAGPLESFIKSDPTRLLFIAVSGGGAGITVLEATRKFDVPWRRWSQKRILLTGGIGGAAIALVLYLIAKYFGLMS
ncbi:MAG TPA: hypothetical protein VK629_03995 [Steroidobacteraceae bacterium]|nr:hypothetical protein [Steroidobacteraceae bacterium]